MKLIVTDSKRYEPSLEYTVMPVAEFNSISSHPFIANSDFDCIILDLNSKFNLEYIQAIVAHNIVIPMVGDVIDSDTISVLSEIYKDRAAELRYTFMKNKVLITDVIERMRLEFRWDQFYIR